MNNVIGIQGSDSTYSKVKLKLDDWIDKRDDNNRTERTNGHKVLTWKTLNQGKTT